MPWTLQPKSFYQAIRPNFYTVAYRRSGAYKGMGSLGQGTSTTVLNYPGMPTTEDASVTPFTPDMLLNLPMTGPYTSQPLLTSAGLAPATMQSAVTAGLTRGVYQNALIMAGLVVLAFVLLDGRRR